MLIKLIYTMILLKEKNIPILPSVIKKIIRFLWGFEIFPTVKIGKNFHVFHGGLGCVFHEKTVIGNGVKIYQNVTLGGNGKKSDKGYNHPIIKDGVIIYAGACVLGAINIGENSIIGANAVVLHDIPPNSIAVGVPARILPKKDMQNY